MSKDPHQEYYLELAPKDFTSYVAKTSLADLAKYRALMVMNNKWLVYPPGNSMPIDAEYFEIPKEIALFSGLRSLVLGNIFINNLPKEFRELKQLTELHLRLAPTANLNDIISILKDLKKLKKIDLSGSIIAKRAYIKFKQSFPDGTVVSITDEMKP